MNLYVINTGFFKLDGGAMFGVVPKTLWQRTNPADENNLCTWAIEDGDRAILIDNGIGDKQDQKFFSHYYLHGDDSLAQSLRQAGFDHKDITDMFLTHLHFDHCGGGVVYDRGADKYQVTFEHAKYWSNQQHWEWATHPNAREKASFLKENILPVQEQGHLEFIEASQLSPFDNLDIIYMDGHTEKQMLPKIRYKDKTIVFVADLIPSASHVPIPYIMGFDVRPLETVKEKTDFLQEAYENDYILFFEHDPVVECCNLKMTEKGIRVNETFALKDIL